MNSKFPMVFCFLFAFILTSFTTNGQDDSEEDVNPRKATCTQADEPDDPPECVCHYLGWIPLCIFEKGHYKCECGTKPLWEFHRRFMGFDSTSNGDD